MLDLGATSFWEDFDVAWLENAGRIDELPVAGKRDVHATYGEHSYKKLRMSLAHGWALGPTSWLTEHVLGVKVVEPGGRTRCEFARSSAISVSSRARIRRLWEWSSFVTRASRMDR